jgi:fumarylacetoacetate (FAA) hydrolase
MKLATYKDGSRDGQLVVVSRDLTTAHYASGIAGRLQQVLDDWNFMSPQLEDLAASLNGGKARHAFPFEPAKCMAPLPRAYQWADGSAFVNHVELVRRARNAEMPASFWTDPLMYQGGSDDFIGPCDDIVAASTDWGIDFEAEVAVITGDIAMGTRAEAAIDGIRLVMLANDVSLRNLIPAELAKGFASSRASRRRRSARSRSRPTSLATPGAAGGSTSTSRAPGTASARACATPARR